VTSEVTKENSAQKRSEHNTMSGGGAVAVFSLLYWASNPAAAACLYTLQNSLHSIHCAESLLDERATICRLSLPFRSQNKL